MVSDLIGVLGNCGLTVSGDPPTVTVSVGATDVEVQIRVDDTTVHLRAEAACGNVPGAARVTEAGATAPGDTSFSTGKYRVSGTRTLAEPSGAAVYDALHDLAKATAVLAGEIHGAEDAAAPSAGSRAASTPGGGAAGGPPEDEFDFTVGRAEPLYSPADYSTVVATLAPGRVYHAKGVRGSWVFANADGVDGWVGVDRVTRR
jgi:hypothetical protein